MNLWLSAHFLFAAFLSSSALTPEECQHSRTPLSLADPSMMIGRWNFLAGYNDNETYAAVLKKTQSSRITMTASPSSPKDVVMTQQNKINGTCLSSSINVTIHGDTASASYTDFSSVFHVLPACEDCLLLSINVSARNQDKLLQQMKFISNVTAEELNAQALYLMGKESTVKDSDLEHFKQQASCLGYSREPDFLYDPKNDFCAEGEGIKISF